MSIEIGTVKTIVGKFWIHNPNGESHLAVIGEMLHEGDRVVGSSANTSNSTFSLDLVGNIDQDIALGANEVLTLDRTFMVNVLGMEDTGANKVPLVAAWDGTGSEELSITIEDDKNPVALADASAAGEGETAAGGAASDGQITPANFEERTGAITDVRTGLLSTAVDGVATEMISPLTSSIILEDELINNAPIANIDNATGSQNDVLTTQEDTSLTIVASTLLANDIDPDGDTLTIVSVQGAVNGTVVLNLDGTITFTPNENYNGTASFTYTVSDGNGATATAIVNVGVTPVDDLPTTEDVDNSGDEDAASISITLTGSDVDGTVDNFSLVTLPTDGVLYTDSALTTLAAINTNYAATGEALTLYFVPNSQFNGDSTFTYVAIDNDSLVDATPATATITVNAVNDLPTTEDVDNSGDEDAASISITLTGSDVDGTVDNFSLVTLPTDGVLYTDSALTTLAAINTNYAATGEALTLYFVPNSQFNGDSTFTYVAIDNDSLVDATPATATITVNAVNDLPTLVINTGNQDNANDAVNESALSTGTNPSNSAEFAYGKFTIGDGDGLSDIKSITLGLTEFTVGLGGLNGLIGSSFNTTYGTVTLTAYVNGIFDYKYELTRPTIDVANQTEMDSFTVKVSDIAGASSSQLTVTINILDDVATLIAPDSIYIQDETTTITRDINFTQYAGADGVGNVVFQIVNGTPATDAQGNFLTFQGNQLYLYYGVDQTVIIASTSSTSSGVNINNASTTGYWLDINPLTDTYTMHSNGIINNGSAITATKSDVISAGHVPFVVITNLENTTKDAILTTRTGDYINTNSTLIGIDNGQNFTYSNVSNYDGLRIDFVNGAQFHANGGGTSDDTYSYDGTHNLTTAYSQKVRGLSSNDKANIKLTAIVADSDNVMYSISTEAGETYVNLSASNISVYNGTTLKVQGSDYTVMDNGNSVTINGLRDGWTFHVNTDTAFSAIQIDAAVNTDKFKLDYFTIGTDYSGDPVALQYSIIGIDGDGDSVNGLINTTLYPDSGRTLSGTELSETLNSDGTGQYILGGAGDDTLYGNDGDDVLIGDLGVDKFYGGAGNDTLISDIHTNADGTLNMTTDSGAGALDGGIGMDTLILAKDGNSIDFSAMGVDGVIKNIEMIDLGHGGDADNHILSNLTLENVIQMTDSNNTLTIMGDGSDFVNIPEATGNYNDPHIMSEGGFDIYTYIGATDDPTVILKIETTISDTII